MPIDILFVLDKFAGPTAGTEAQFWLLLRNLDSEAFRVHVVTLEHSEFLAENLPRGTYECLGVSKIASVEALAKVTSFCLRARSRGVRVAHLWLNDASILMPLPLFLSGVRVIVSRRDLGFWYSAGILKALRVNQHFVWCAVANCEAVRSAVLQHEKYDPGRVIVIHNGVELPRGPIDPPGYRARLGIRPGATVFGMLANLRSLKRVDVAVRALARVGTAEASLLVAGEDRHENGRSVRRDLEELARSLGVEGAVHFIGGVSRPWQVLEEIDVLLSCSETEGLSNTIIEAMSSGRPVIATAVGGTPELVDDPGTGRLVEVGDVDALARAMREMAGDPVLRSRLGVAGRHRAERMFSASAMVGAHAALYRRAVELASATAASTASERA